MKMNRREPRPAPSVPRRRGLNRRERYALIVLLTLFLVLATVYNAVSTPFEAPDEIGHFYYVVHLLQTGRLPVVPADTPPPSYEHEGAQPPLYYVTSALFVRVLSAPLRLDLEDAGAPLDINPHSTCGRPDACYNVVYLAHDPHQERFPYGGRVRVLHVVRLWSSLLGMATVAGVFAAVRSAFPGAPAAAWLAAGLAAFTPEFLFTAGAVSNDNLVTALTTWGVYLALRLLRDGLRWPRTLGLGLLAGLAALSKLSGALLLPLALLVIPLAAMLQRPRLLHQKSSSHSFAIPHLSFVIRHSSFVILSFLAVAGWWFLRNWTLYGDLTGTLPILDALSLRHGMSAGVLIRELPGLFCSWWGVFGCTVPPAGFYLFYLPLVLVGLAGLVVAILQLPRPPRRKSSSRRFTDSPTRLFVALLLLVWLVLMLAAYIRWNWAIHAPKGRLLYPAIVSVAGFLGRGWACWAARRRWLTPALLILLALGAGATPFVVMAPPVSPPPIYSTVAGVHPEHPLAGRFGSDITLLGYDLDDVSFEPGEWLDLTLYWRALAQPSDHYTLAIQLVSAVTGETAALVNFNTWTGGGNYPTGVWHPGDVIADRYRLRIPDDVPRAQGWYLQAIFFNGTDGTRLPFTLDGRPSGDTATLTLLRVGASNPEEQAPPETDRLASPIYFDGAVALDGVRVTGAGGQEDTGTRGQGGGEEEKALGVTLWWRSVAPLAGDYVVFVHLYDSAGQLIATADAPPLSGGFPTSLWQPDDRVRGERVVSLPEGVAPFQLGVGWYDPATGARLAATTAGGVRLPSDEVLVPIPPLPRLTSPAAAISGTTSGACCQKGLGQ